MGSTKKIAFSAMMIALSVVIMLIASVSGFMDLSFSIFASVCTLITVCEIGRKYAFLVYAATSVLSFLVLPVRDAAFIYALSVGFYPIIKSLTEKLPRVWEYIIKILVFCVCYAVLYFVFTKLFAPEAESIFMEIVTFVLGLIAFIAYDFCLTLFATIYIRKIRKMLGINKLFK